MPLAFSHGVVANAGYERLRMISAEEVLEELRLHPVLFLHRRIGRTMSVQRKERINIELATVRKGADHDLLNVPEISVSAERAITSSRIEPAAPHQHWHSGGFDLRAQTKRGDLRQVDRSFGRLDIVITELWEAQTV